VLDEGGLTPPGLQYGRLGGHPGGGVDDDAGEPGKAARRVAQRCHPGLEVEGTEGELGTSDLLAGEGARDELGHVRVVAEDLQEVLADKGVRASLELGEQTAVHLDNVGVGVAGEQQDRPERATTDIVDSPAWRAPSAADALRSPAGSPEQAGAVDGKGDRSAS